MPHISKERLKENIFLKIHCRLIKTLKSAASNGSLESTLGELLTETEEVMLAKRLSVIFLLQQGESAYSIYKSLKMSYNTIYYMQDHFEQGDYANIQKLFSKKKEQDEMWKYLEVIIRGGMPAYGRNRWKGWGKS